MRGNTRVHIAIYRKCAKCPRNILLTQQIDGVVWSCAQEQMTVFCSLLHGRSPDGIPLLPDTLRRGPLVDEAGYPRVRPRLLSRLGEAVQNVARGQSGEGDIETRLRQDQFIILNWSGPI
jgi:ribulose-5-phosphate 4-epimerase/fuculose-1-phosphate aldolase